MPTLHSHQPSRPKTLEAHDRGFRRRMTIAVAISLAINAVIFGYAGVLGHQFIHSLVVMREKDSEVSIRRVFVPASKLKAMSQPRPASPAASPSTTSNPEHANR